MDKRYRYSDKEVIKIAKFIDRGYSTYQAAYHFKIPQSTIWYLVRVRLKNIDQALYWGVNYTLTRNWKGGGR